MSVNKFDDHLLVLPEDEHDERLANGFVLHPSVKESHIRVLPQVRGWGHVVEEFEKNRIQQMLAYPKRRIVLLIDFDERHSRREMIEQRIPSELKDRVFLIGSWNEPRDLKAALGGRPLEEIGQLLAEDCYRNTDTTWSHPLLEHNKAELARLREQVRPFLCELSAEVRRSNIGRLGLAEKVMWAVSHRVSSTWQRGNPNRRLRRNQSCG